MSVYDYATSANLVDPSASVATSDSVMVGCRACCQHLLAQACIACRLIEARKRCGKTGGAASLLANQGSFLAAGGQRRVPQARVGRRLGPGHLLWQRHQQRAGLAGDRPGRQGALLRPAAQHHGAAPPALPCSPPAPSSPAQPELTRPARCNASSQVHQRMDVGACMDMLPCYKLDVLSEEGKVRPEL